MLPCSRSLAENSSDWPALSVTETSPFGAICPSSSTTLIVTEDFFTFELIKRTKDCCEVLSPELRKFTVESPFASAFTTALMFVKKPSGVRIKLCADRSSAEAIVSRHLPIPSPNLPDNPFEGFPFSRS